MSNHGVAVARRASDIGRHRHRRRAQQLPHSAHAVPLGDVLQLNEQPAHTARVVALFFQIYH